MILNHGYEESDITFLFRVPILLLNGLILHIMTILKFQNCVLFGICLETVNSITIFHDINHFERVEILCAKVMLYDENDLPIYNFISLPEVSIMKIMIELAVLR